MYFSLGAPAQSESILTVELLGSVEGFGGRYETATY
jgi:hypothetical protein